jgi:hypothetical protein
MSHQVEYCDGSIGRHCLDRPLSDERTFIQHGDTPVAELRQKSLDRIGQPEASLFPKQQCSHSRDGLSHGSNREHCIARHRGASVRAEVADGFVKNKVLSSGNSDDRTGKLACFNLFVQRSDYSIKSRGRHADRFRLRTR